METDVDSIGRLSPAISIDQKRPVKTPVLQWGRQQINGYLRLLYARVGRLIVSMGMERLQLLLG